MNFAMPSGSQVNAAMRHVYTVCGTILALGTAVAIVPADQVQPIVDALHQVGDGLETMLGGASKLLVIVGPIIAGLMAKIAATSAGFNSQLNAVTAAAQNNTAAKAELAAATANVPGIVQVRAAPEIANATADPKVVAAQPR